MARDIHLAPILERMGMESSTWCECLRDFGKYFKRVAGTPESIADEAHKVRKVPRKFRLR